MFFTTCTCPLFVTSSFLIISIKLSYQSLISFRVASSPPNWLTTFRFTSSISICIALNISSTCHIYRIYSATLLFLFSRAINILTNLQF